VPEFFQVSLPRSTLRCSRSVTAPAFRCARRRLRFRAHSRLWREVAPARPPARIAPSRRLRARHRRLCRASTCADSSLPSRRSPALRSAPARQPRSLREEGNFSRAAPSPFLHAQSPRGWRCALWIAPLARGNQPSHALTNAYGGTCASGRSSAQAPPSVHTSKGRTTMSDKIVAPSNHSPLPPNPITALLVFFERRPAAGFAMLHPVVSLRDLHPAGSLRFPHLAPEPAASAFRPPI
jgi:hypothetical protein